MKLRDPSHEIDVFERNPPGVTFGWGVVFSDQTVENLHGQRPRVGRRSSPTSSPIGTTSTSISAARRSPRRATASSASAASGCSKSCRTARASSASSCTSKPSATPPIRSGATTTWSSPPTASTRASATRYADAFGVDVDVRANKFVWLGTSQGVRRLHLRVRGDRARLDLGARLPLRARLLDLHRRMLGGDLARPRLRPDGPGRSDRRCARSSSPNISTATR